MVAPPGLAVVSGAAVAAGAPCRLLAAVVAGAAGGQQGPGGKQDKDRAGVAHRVGLLWLLDYLKNRAGAPPVPVCQAGGSRSTLQVAMTARARGDLAP